VIRVSPGYFAVLLIYMVSISDDIKRLLSNITKSENRFVSFERCYFFMTIPAEEGYKYLPQLKRHFKKMVEDDDQGKVKEFVPPEDLAGWPRSGSVELRNFSVKYRLDLDYVLRNISFKLESGEKLGILGRTGAGKSTLISSMYRYFSNFEGDVLIDGVPIKTIDVQHLRSALTIIPQDPILFNATIRKNIDPSDRHTAAEVENVLKEIGLWEKFEQHHGVEFMVDVGGANLSQGEKQLVCFGRALLEKNKVILMDEATANIDSMTEKTIQKLMEEKFGDSTIMMIAHKLNTILICDK
jgi:ABC-type multidrug transport system fused ATPase/permease subunit